MILRYFRKVDWLMLAACLLLIAGQVYFDLKIPEYMSEITDHLQTGTATDIIADDGIKMMACAFASLVLAILTTVLATRIASSLCRTLRKLQFENVERFSKQDMEKFSAASLITRSTNDVYHLQRFVARAIQVIIKAPIMAVWAVWKISGSAFEWTSMTIIAMIILTVSISVLLHYGIPYIRKIQWITDDINRVTRENLDGMRTIRSYNAEEFRSEEFDKTSDRLLDGGMAATRILSPLHAISSSMLNFLTLAIYWIGAAIIGGTTNQTDQMYLFSDMIVFTAYAAQVLTSVMMAVSIIRGTATAMVSSRRIEEVIDYTPSIRDGTGADPETKGEVEFRNVCFSYPGGGKEILSDISFKIGKGETLAIIGSTGSGKSTLIKLIARFYDATSGLVLVDGTDVRDYRLGELYSRLGYVSQNAIIFSDSVRNNVNYGKDSSMKTDSDVKSALKTARAENFVDNMPNRYDQSISQHGRNLSGGQKQRISIARAICKKPEIYLFDDSFSALDYITDMELRKALGKETEGSTKIIVAQRIGAITEADLILVMDGGKIVGSGKHDYLLETCEIYREIADSQFSDREEAP
jgi:ATP-binding cassette subfamily B multidrug efflux pump